MDIKGLVQIEEDALNPDDLKVTLGDDDLTLRLVKKINLNLDGRYKGEVIIFTSLINDDWKEGILFSKYAEMIGYSPDEKFATIQEMFNWYVIGLNRRGNRIPYNVIASIVYEMDKNSFFPDNFDTQRDRIGYNLSVYAKDDEDSLELLGKYEDKITSHFELSYIQSKFIKESVANVTKQAEEAQKKLGEIESALEKIKNTKGQIYTEFITILGIFSALMFGMITGFNSLTEALGEIANSDLYIGKVIMGISAIMMGLVSFVYVLLKWIGILIDKPLEDENDNLSEGLNGFQLFFLKNKFFVSVNFSLVVLFLVGIILFVSSVSGITFSLTRNRVGALHVIAIIVILITIVMPGIYNKWSKPDKGTNE